MRFGLYGTYFIIITVLLLAAIGGAIWVLMMDYDTLVASVITTVHKNGLEEKIRNGIFTRSRFIFLQHIAWLIFVLAPYCCWVAFRYRHLVAGYSRVLLLSVYGCVKSFARVFKDNSIRQNRSVLILIILLMLFYMYRMTTTLLTYDEMWSYNYYTDHPFYYSFFTYSNYPLFEMSTHFFKWLPLPMKINLRLSPFIFGITSCLLLYGCINKYVNSHFTALAGAAAFACMPITMVYMVNARGVMHELFFAITGIFSFLFLVKQYRPEAIPGYLFFIGGSGRLFASYPFFIASFSAGLGSAYSQEKNGPAIGLFIC